MKKISDATIDALKAISPATLVNHGVIKTAPNYSEKYQRGYICPLCGSGERGGTGAGTFDANNKFYCHVCKNADVGGHKLSPIDLYTIAHGLKGESFGKIVREMATEFSVEISEENYNSPRKSRRRHQTPPPKPKAEPVNPAELELIRADLNASDEPLIKFVESCGGKWRGLPIDILIRHGFKFIAEWRTPKSRVAGKYSTPTPRVLIPSGENFYVARFVGNLDDYDGTTRKFVEDNKKLNAGQPKLFLSRQDVLDSAEPIIAVEGVIDAVSCELAGFDAVALNAGGNRDLLVNALRERLAAQKKLPPIIIMMDADERGRNEFAPKLYDALIDIGCPCCVRFLFNETTKTDFNDVLIRDGVDNLRERLESIVDSARAELDACAVELERRKAERIDDELIDFLFTGDASDLDFARRFEKFFGDEIRWLTDDKIWLLYQRTDCGGGLWHDGGEQNSCLLPRIREMADVMITYAENSDERELADKLKRTRKILSSITMLKSLDSVLITADDLDKHGELLNVRNGVVDLTSGKLMKASPELLLTQTAAAVYNPKSTDTTFAEFFKSVLPDEETRRAILRYLGYCLTGDVREEKFLMIHGRGGNGKGVTLLTLRTLLGDYCCELPVDTVLEDKRFSNTNGRATTELTPLVNRRLGIVDELPRNARFDVAKVNRLTGRDYLPIRQLHHEYYDTKPTHKLILTGNYRPQIDDPRDVALLRRLIVVNFAQDFSQNPDTALKDKLLADSALSGALNVIVPAAVDWYRDGLLKPSTLMNQARQEFLDENDFISDFLAEYYEFGTGKDFTISRKDLLKHLREQCADAARYRDSDLCNMIAKVDGVTLRKKDNLQIFQGIKLAPPQNPQQGELDGFGEEIVSSADYPPFD